jgi:YVTN family beta-propeller protein
MAIGTPTPERAGAERAIRGLDPPSLAVLSLWLRHGREDVDIAALLRLSPDEVARRREAAAEHVAGAAGIPPGGEELAPFLAQVAPAHFDPETRLVLAPRRAAPAPAPPPPTATAGAPRRPAPRRGIVGRFGWRAPALLLVGLALGALIHVTLVDPAGPSTTRPAAEPVPPRAAPASRTMGGLGPVANLRRHPANVYAAATLTQVQPQLFGITPRVYIPETLAGAILVVDPTTFKVVGQFPAGKESQHVTPSWDMSRLYADNAVGNSLTEIDPKSGKAVRTIPVRDPYNLYFTPDGRSAVVAAERYNRLDFRDPRTWKLQGSVRVPGNGVDHLDFSADGRSLLVSLEYSGDVVKIDARRMKVLGAKRVGGLPVDIKLSPDGTLYYVANQGLGGVSVLDSADLHKVAFLKTGKGAHGLAVSRDARSIYVSNRLAGTISVIDLSARRVAHTWKVGGSPDMLQVDPSGRQLWFSNRFHAGVTVISTRDGHQLGHVATGAGPHGLSFFPQPGRYSLGHNGVYR